MEKLVLVVWSSLRRPGHMNAFARASRAHFETMSQPDRATPPDVLEQAEKLRFDAIPTASRDKYEAHYKLFGKYLSEHGGDRNATNDNMLGFLGWMSEKVNGKARYAASSRNSIISALKTMLFAREQFPTDSLCWSTTQQHTADALKSHIPKQSKVLSEGQVTQYFEQAPSTDAHLCRKVIASVVIAGGLRVDSFYHAMLSDIERKDDGGYRIIVTHLKQVQKVDDRVLEFSPHQDGMPITHPSQWLDLYLPIRKANTSMTAFMLQVRNNKVVAMRVGENTMRSVWSTIAEFVGATDPRLYTGHGMKRYSVGLAVDRGFSGPQLQAQFKWRSSATAMRYIEGNVSTKRKQTDLLMGVTPASSAPMSASSTTLMPTPTSQMGMSLFAGATFNAPVHVIMSGSRAPEVIEESALDMDKLFEGFAYKKAKK